jgi:hypothetical protein
MGSLNAHRFSKLKGISEIDVFLKISEPCLNKYIYKNLSSSFVGLHAAFLYSPRVNSCGLLRCWSHYQDIDFISHEVPCPEQQMQRQIIGEIPAMYSQILLRTSLNTVFMKRLLT